MHIDEIDRLKEFLETKGIFDPDKGVQSADFRLEDSRFRPLIWHFNIFRGFLPKVIGSITTESHHLAGRTIAKTIAMRSANTVCWQRAWGWGYVGHPAYIYIEMKMRKFDKWFQPKANSNKPAEIASELIAICTQASNEIYGNRSDTRVSTWWRGDSRFIDKMDQWLLQRFSHGELNRILSAIGLDLRLWMHP